MLAGGCKTQIFSPGRVTGNIGYFYFGLIVEKKSFLYQAVNINAKSLPASHRKLETFFSLAKRKNHKLYGTSYTDIAFVQIY